VKKPDTNPPSVASEEAASSLIAPDNANRPSVILQIDEIGKPSPITPNSHAEVARTDPPFSHPKGK
jgi:hypothetical protein